MPRLYPSRWLPLAAVLLLAGCERDEIRTYTVPKPPPPRLPAAKVRLLGGIFTHGKEQWFFKLVGPVDEIGKYADDFDRFLLSIRFSDKADRPIDWTLPAGWAWEKSKPGGLRWATVFPAGKGKSPELTVSRFDRISSILDNVNRWARQDVGRMELTDEAIGEVTKEIQAGPHEGIRVDMTGPGAKKGAHPPMMGGGPAPPPPPAAGKAITYATPKTWKETGPRGGFVPVYMAFDVGGKSAEMQITILGAQIGDPLENYNRWRSQVGLGPVRQIDPPPIKVKVGDLPGELFDLTGPGGPSQKRMLLVVVKRQQQTWFFKLIGDAEVVGKNRTEFDSFLQSIKFTGAADE
jgi:hypothetical protein